MLQFIFQKFSSQFLLEMVYIIYPVTFCHNTQYEKYCGCYKKKWFDVISDFRLGININTK